MPGQDTPTSALGTVIHALAEARDVALDVDEDLARSGGETRLGGVTFSIASLDELIEILRAVERLHGANARRLRWAQAATLGFSILALVLSLLRW
jgi:hypothetical protein